jgi:cysteine-rich repeat protein
MVRPSPLALSVLLVGGCLNPWTPMGGSSSSSTTWLADSSSGDSTGAGSSTGDESTTAGAHSDSSAMSGSTGAGPGSTTAAAPVCGDGVVDGPEEECDDANDVDEDGCDNTCLKQRVVFATSTRFTAGYLKGLEGADGLCKLWAVKAGLKNPGSFTAWLSDSQNDARDRIYPGRGRYVRVDGTVVAHGADQFSSGTLLAPINVDELSQTVIGATWTGTLPDGTAVPGSGHCDDWTNDFYLDIDGYYGLMSAVDGVWTHDPDETNPTSCAKQYNLYCIEGE